MELEYLDIDGSIVLAALFLRGSPSGTSLAGRHGPKVLNVLRRECPSPGKAACCLREHGIWEGAVLLDSPGRLSWAEFQVEGGLCVTIASSNYPRRLLRALGCGAPPAMWLSGRADLLNGPTASIAGSRRISDRIGRFAHRAGEACSRHGLTVVSGGATGCDSLAEAGAIASGGVAVRVLPHGLQGCYPCDGVTLLSALSPNEGFSSAGAMERNRLVYAMSDRALVVHGRYREGGTWAGATDALRRGLTNVFVRSCPEPWAGAMRALGARPVSRAEDFLSDPIDVGVEKLLYAPA